MICYRHRPLGNTSLQVFSPGFFPKVLLHLAAGDWGEPREDYHRRFSVNQGLPELQNSEWHLGLDRVGMIRWSNGGDGVRHGMARFRGLPLRMSRFLMEVETKSV